jgi:spermidine synthase
MRRIFLAKNTRRFDLIFTDLFSAQGMAPCLQDYHFYQQALDSLNPLGVHCLNLWASQPFHYAQIKAFLSEHHPEVVYEKDAVTSNVTAFALHPENPPCAKSFANQLNPLEKQPGFSLRD